MDEHDIRLFIALTLPDIIRSNLSHIIQPCISMPDRIKWVEEHNMHLTLKFIGSTSGNMLQPISTAIASSISNTTRFLYELKGLACFPNLALPRVLFAGASQGMQELQTIVNNLEDNLATLGIEKEKRDFKPHITIGRFKTNRGTPRLSDQLLNFIGSHKTTTFGSFTVENITLMKSTLTPEGPIYTPLYTQPLE